MKRLNYKEARGGKNALMILEIDRSKSPEEIALIAAGQRNVPLMCALAWALQFAVNGSIQIPPTRDLMESEFDLATVSGDVASMIEELYY